MYLLKQTQQNQSGLANYCRSGVMPELKGIIPENISQYRRLVYNVIDDMLQNAYPLTFDLLTDEEWDSAINDFFRIHKCQSPQVWYMPKEFYVYLSKVQHPLLRVYPFLEELLQFEWAEVELFMMPDIKNEHLTNGSISKDKLVINPEHKLFAFEFPVHRKNAGSIDITDRGDFYVIGYRNKNGDVKFTDLSPALLRLLEYLQEAPRSITELFEQFQAEFNIQLTAADKQHLIQFFEVSLKQELIIGFQLKF